MKLHAHSFRGWCCVFAACVGCLLHLWHNCALCRHFGFDPLLVQAARVPRKAVDVELVNLIVQEHANDPAPRRRVHRLNKDQRATARHFNYDVKEVGVCFPQLSQPLFMCVRMSN